MRLTLFAILVLGAVLPVFAADDTASVSRQLDQIVEQDCTSAGITPLGTCSDAAFLRRVWLDLAGRTPPLREATKLASGTKLDRVKTVEDLLKSPDFARHWGRVWAEYLTDRRPFDSNEYDGRRLLRFLTEALQENQPYGQIISELMAGEGTSDISGPANFLLRYNAEPLPLAGAVSQKFLGLSLACAECHDHPHAAWKQKDFWGLAAHFARLRKMTPTNPAEGETFFVVIERPRGELTMPDKQAKPDENGNLPRKTVFPQLPGQPRTDLAQPRRDVLVKWLTDPANPYPSRHFTNIVWERLLGARLIQNLDEWPPASSSSNVALLNLLADDFNTHQGDIQRLLREIVLSETYQRVSHSAEKNTVAADRPRVDLENEHRARARIRPLSADQLHLSVGQAFGYHFDENDFRLAEPTGEEFTYDIPIDTFGPTPHSLVRSVALYNSDYVRGAVELGAEAAVRLHGPAVGAEHIERLFLALLSRKPTPDELETFLELGGDNDARQGLQDVAWVLLNSTEFVTNH